MPGKGVLCPVCRGDGTVAAFLDTAERGWFDPALPCSLCGGTGQISEQQAAWRTVGRAHYRARVARQESIMECADRLGIRPAELSAMEHGRADPTPLAVDTPIRSGSGDG